MTTVMQDRIQISYEIKMWQPDSNKKIPLDWERKNEENDKMLHEGQRT